MACGRSWPGARGARLWAAAWPALATLGAGGCDRGPKPGAALETTASFGEVGTSPGQFSYPRCLDHDGRTLWTIDKQARVQRLDAATGAWLGGWRMPAWANGKPAGITTWTPAGRAGGEPFVFVADTHYHRVLVYDAAGSGRTGADGRLETGRLVAEIGAYGTEPGEFVYPTDIAVVPTEDGTGIARLYVSEYGANDRVSVFEPAGGAWRGEAGSGASADGGFEFKFAFGQFGSGETEFSRPQSIVYDSMRDELIVADACNHRVGRFRPEGTLVAWYGGAESAGEGAGRFKYPYGLALLDDGTALVAEFGNNRVQRIDLSTGAGMGTYGHAGRGEGELANPWAVAVLGETAYVLDSGNNRVQGFGRPRGRSRVGGAPAAAPPDGGAGVSGGRG